MATKQWTPKTRDELKKLVDGGVSLANIDTIFVDDMSGLFEDSTRTDFSGIEEWNVSNVESMYAMFRNAKHFNANINSWNVSRVTKMWNMFGGAESFNQPLDKWDTSRVTEMSFMFKDAKAFNQPLNSWNVSKVLYMGSMFEGAESFNSNIDDWDIAKLLEGYFRIPEKRSLSLLGTPTDNDYIKKEKKEWEWGDRLKKEFFAHSPLASNPPKWFKDFVDKKKEFVKQYEAREKKVADFFQQVEKEEEQRRKKTEAAWQAEQAKRQAEETKEKVKKLIWIGLGVVALLYFFIK